VDLVLFDKAKQAIAEAMSIDEVRDIRNKAQAMKYLSRLARQNLKGVFRNRLFAVIWDWVHIPSIVSLHPMFINAP
jgi:hypothetical protein